MDALEKKLKELQCEVEHEYAVGHNLPLPTGAAETKDMEVYEPAVIRSGEVMRAPAPRSLSGNDTGDFGADQRGELVINTSTEDLEIHQPATIKRGGEVSRP